MVINHGGLTLTSPRDGPAVEWILINHGELTVKTSPRNGPAVEWIDGDKSWWING